MASELDSAEPGWIRLLPILIGIFILLWLPIEDSQTIIVSILSALLVLTVSWNQWLQNSPKKLWQHVLFGAAAGLAVLVTAVLLMLIKNRLRGHSNPEFNIIDLSTMVYWIPVWMMGGSLFYLGAGFWYPVVRRE